MEVINTITPTLFLTAISILPGFIIPMADPWHWKMSLNGSVKFTTGNHVNVALFLVIT